MKVLVIGGSGFIGSYICDKFSNNNNNIVIETFRNYKRQSENLQIKLDLSKPIDLSLSVFENVNLIIFCAGYTNVDGCELDELKSYQNNVQPCYFLKSLAEKNKSQLMYLSTDYVFNGDNGPYEEDEKDELRPLNVYGRHKLEGEQIIKSYPNHLILRVTNVFGIDSKSKNFISQLLNHFVAGLQIKCISDQYSTPVYAKDIADAAYLLSKDQKKGIYNIASDDYLNRYEIACFFKRKGYDPIIESISSEQSNQIAKRPLLGGLNNSKFKNEYPNFQFKKIKNYIDEIK